MSSSIWRTWSRAAAAAMSGVGFLLAVHGGTAAIGLTPNTTTGSLTGKLLVADRKMGDPRFQKTVIYMIEHGEDGALGLVVNRPAGELPIAELLRNMGLEPKDATGQIQVYAGGPVEPGRGFILHSTDMMPAGSHQVSADIAVTVEADVLRAIGRGEGPKHSLFVLGYAGWAAGQLEAELSQEGWFVIPARPDLIFTDTPERTWQRALDLRGIEL
jgi:putative transcriptional regulator